MNIIETALPGVLIVEPKVFGDARGYFFESWNQAAAFSFLIVSQKTLHLS